MFNAKLVQLAVSDEWLQPTDVSVSSGDIRENWNAMERLFQTGAEELAMGGVPCIARRLHRAAFVQFLNALRWNQGRELLAAEKHFFLNDPAAVKEWLVALPQLQSRSGRLGGLEVSVHERSLTSKQAFKVFSDPKHLKAAKQWCSQQNQRVGVLLVYPTYVKSGHQFAKPIVGIALYHPAVPTSAASAVFTVRDKSHRDAVVVGA